MPITTKVVSSKPVHGEVYSIQHYVIKFANDLRKVGGFHSNKTDHHNKDGYNTQRKIKCDADWQCFLQITTRLYFLKTWYDSAYKNDNVIRVMSIVMVMVFDATCYNISVILWWSVLLLWKPPTFRKSLANYLQVVYLHGYRNIHDT
jgi:hypothetical protein